MSEGVSVCLFMIVCCVHVYLCVLHGWVCGCACVRACMIINADSNNVYVLFTGSSNDSQKIQRISLPPQVIAHGYITLGE